MGVVDKPRKSPLLHFYNKHENLYLLIDTGAEISVVKPTIQEKKNQTSDRKLASANGTSITTYGNRIVHLQFDNGEIFR